MIAGTAYGVALNDRDERAALAEAFGRPPYQAPPAAPVVYIKPRATMIASGAPVSIPAPVRLSATIALLFARDATHVAPAMAMTHVGAACLALDISLPQPDYYRPAIAAKCCDGFLPLGRMAPVPAAFGAIITRKNGVEVHRWSLDRLFLPIPDLIARLSGFMTLRAGDLLLVGLPGDAPMGEAGQMVEICSAGLPTLTTRLSEEAE